MIREIARGIFRLVQPVAKRIKSRIGQEAVEVFQNQQAEAAVMKGWADNGFVNLGILTRTGHRTAAWKNPETLQKFKMALDKGDHYASPETREAVDGMRKMLNKALHETQKAGNVVRVNSWIDNGDGTISKRVSKALIGKQENYFPHYFKRDWAEAFVRDGDTAFKRAASITDNWKIYDPKMRRMETADLQELERQVNNMLRGKGFDERTERSINLLMQRDKISPAQAMIALRERGMSQIDSPFGLLSKSRKFNLMSEAYEEDPIVALETYFRGWAKRTAELKAWGPNLDKWKQTFNQIAAEAPDELRPFELITEYINGSAEYKYTNNIYRQLAKGITEFEVGTKIGMGTAFIPNVTQHLISTFPKVGLLKTIRASLKAFTPEGRELATKTGIQGRKFLAMELMAGLPDDYTAYSPLSKFLVGKYNPGMRAFQWINKQNNIVSALAGELHVKDMYRLARKGNKRALRELSKYGVDHTKKLTDYDVQKAMFRFATEMQLQRNPLLDPLWMNDPRFRLLALFKRFGLRQFTMCYDNVLKEAVAHGNIAPLLRLAAGGAAGGAMVVWAKDALRRGLFRDPRNFDEDDKISFKQLGFFYAQGGAGGMISDILGRTKGTSAKEIMAGYFDNAMFSAYPIVASEITGIPGNKYYKGWVALAKDLVVDWADEEKEWMESNVDFMREGLGKVSPLGSMAVSASRARKKQKKDQKYISLRIYGGYRP